MTASSPDRLDRIETLLDQTVAVAAENTQRFTELAEAMLLLSQSQRQTNQNLDIVIDRIDATVQRIDVMQSEVRGLQTEMRHIWGHLFGEENTP